MIALTATFSIQAQVQVTAELDKTNILIGDQVNLKITIGAKPEVVIQRLDDTPLSQVEKLEVVKAGSTDSLRLEDGSWLLLKNIVLTSFDSGYYFIPPLTVHFLRDNAPDSATSAQLGLLVSTIPNVSDSTQLAPIKNIIGEPLAFSDFLPWLIAIAAFVGLILWIRYLRKRKTAEVSEVQTPPLVLPPHQVALEQLQALKQRQLWQKGAIKDYHSELSHIVRTYLEGRFSIPALESTTLEIVQTLGSNTTIPAGSLAQLKRLLETSDLVKFAKAIPAPDIHDALFDQAVAFVQQTQLNPVEEQNNHDQTS
jgi:hypothetical protein